MNVILLTYGGKMYANEEAFKAIVVFYRVTSFARSFLRLFFLRCADQPKEPSHPVGQ